MHKPRFFALALGSLFAASLTTPSTAVASPEGIGVGVESPLTTGAVTGAFVYDTGSFHIDGLLGFTSAEGDADFVVAGARGWYAVHQAAQADFHLGGGLQLIYTDFGGGDDDDDLAIGVELGAKLRAFLTSNVALHGVVGLAIVVGDDVSDRVSLTGQLTGGLGITYFFN